MPGSAGDKYIGLDRFGRVVDQRWTTSGGTAKDRWKYGYDRNSNPLYKENLVDSTRSELFTYDGLNQLATFARGTLNGTKDAISGTPLRSQSWDFDALGNFDSQTTDGSTQTRTHNKQNELTAATGQTSPTYDANGNQTKDFADRRFKVDAWNRIVEVQPAGGGSAIRNYEHDALGRRIQETASGTTTDLYYSAGWQVLEERVGGNAKASYAWSPIYVDALVARDRDTDGNGSLDERLYALHDANYNVTALVNPSGSVVERCLEDPFGTPSYFDAGYGSRSSSNYGWNYLHQGLRWDGTTGKYWNRNRDYDPVQGRFTANDPKGFGAGDVSFYRYVGNGPVGGVDPSGLDWWEDAEKIGKKVYGGVKFIESKVQGVVAEPVKAFGQEVGDLGQRVGDADIGGALKSGTAFTAGVWKQNITGGMPHFLNGPFAKLQLLDPEAGMRGETYGPLAGAIATAPAGGLGAAGRVPTAARGIPVCRSGVTVGSHAETAVLSNSLPATRSVPGPAHAPVTGSQWLQILSGRYGAENVTWSRVPPYGGGKTQGVLATSVGEVDLISGYAGPSAMMSDGAVPGMNYILKAHVEAHAACAMRQLGLKDATLYLNQLPCVWRNGGGCNAMLPRMLGEGRQLRVVVPNQMDQVFIGVGR